MRNTRACPPIAALICLLLSLTPCHTQHYLLCKTHGYDVCLAFPLKILKDDLPKLSGMVCGTTKTVGLNKIRDQVHKVESLSTGMRKMIFCRRIVYVKKVLGPFESYSDYINPYYRTRRQATLTPRGRYRGQTQSQYLSIDGNGKDEGKAEAQSAADSSRASVSGNSGMGQAQSQSIYDPSCDDCYGTPRRDIGSIGRQPGGTNAYGPGSGIDYSGYPVGTGYPDQSVQNSPYSPGQNGYFRNGKPYVNGRYGPDNRNIPGKNGQNGGKFGPNANSNGYDPGRNIYNPSGNGNDYGPGLYNKFSPQGSELLYPDGSSSAPGITQSAGTEPNGSYGNGANPIPRFTGSPDNIDIPGGNTQRGNRGPNTGGNYAPQQQSYPPIQSGGVNGSPGRDFNSQTKYPTQDSQNIPGSNRNGNQNSGPNDYIPENVNGFGQYGSNRNYNTPESKNSNDKTYYNSGPNGIYSPDHRSTDGYTPNGSSLAPGQLNTPNTNQKLNPENIQTEIDRYTPIHQQAPNNVGNNGLHSGPYVPGQGKQANWPVASGPFQGPDGKSYICCEVPGKTASGTAYGTNNKGVPNNHLSPDSQYAPGSIFGGEYRPGGAVGINPSTIYNPDNVSGQGGGRYGPSVFNQPGASSGTGSSQPSGGGAGNQFNYQNGPGQYGPVYTSGSRPGQNGPIGTNPGYQYGTGGPVGPYIQSGLNGKNDGSGTTQGGPGRQYRPEIGPGVNNNLAGIPGAQYGPKNNYGNEAGVPGQYGPGSGQNTPVGETGSINKGPGNLYTSGGRPEMESPGQYLPGNTRLPVSSGLTGQYSPGRGSSIGLGSQYLPGGSGSENSGMQYPQVSGPVMAPGGQYIPGSDSSLGTDGLRRQYSPGGGGLIGPGGQYLSKNDGGPIGGNRERKYFSGSGPDVGPGRNNISDSVGRPGANDFGGQFSPGSGISTRPGGQYNTGSGSSLGSGSPASQYPSRGELDRQNFPGSNIGPRLSNVGEIYSPGSSMPRGNYLPGSDRAGPSSRDPNSQYAPQTDPVGSGGQYYPGSGTPGGLYTPGSNTASNSIRKYPYGQNGHDNQYIPGTEVGSPGSQYLPNGDASGGGLHGGIGSGEGLPGGVGYEGGQSIGDGSGGSLPGGQYLPGGGGLGGAPNGRPSSVLSTGRYPNSQAGTDYGPGGANTAYNNVPLNYVDPQSVDNDDDSEAEAVVSQAINGTTASASSKGGNDKGRAQTHVQGTYTGSGSFQAEAQIAGENKEAESAVSGGKKGASSSATGSGRNNKSQANVQLGSETGAVQTNSQSSGAMHSSNSQVQGSVKGGMADAQARGPGSTSSQAQIGFTPYKDDEKAKHESQKIPFVGGGVASAQSSGRTGQSQSQLHGTFKYGISYNGAAQAGASLAKDAVFPNRLSFEKLNVFDEKNKNINVDLLESSPEPETEKIPESTTALPELVVEEQNEIQTTEQNLDEILKDSESGYDTHSHGEHHNQETTSPVPTLTDNRRSFHNNYYGTEYDTYTTDKDENDDYDSDGALMPDVPEGDQGAEYANYDEYRGDNTHQSLQSTNKKELEVRQTTGGNTQHIVLGSLKKHDATITQKNSERPDEKKIYQPGERVPGTGGYTIPLGFTGSVKSVASKDKTYVLGSRDYPSQAQSVTLTPGTGKIRYTHPSGYGKFVNPTNLRSLNSKRDDDRYVSVSKSVTRDLDNDNNIRKQYSHTYYTKSSSCGYFTFTCTMVSSAEGKKKVCKPKIPTNPDGSPIRC